LRGGAVLADGFTATGGRGAIGAGIACQQSDIGIFNCAIEQNKTRGTQGNGAGIHSSDGSLPPSNRAFQENWAWADGGCRMRSWQPCQTRRRRAHAATGSEMSA
jgi:hypothetical protein